VTGLRQTPVCLSQVKPPVELKIRPVPHRAAGAEQNADRLSGSMDGDPERQQD
jgi:hypothetical protein